MKKRIVIIVMMFIGLWPVTYGQAVSQTASNEKIAIKGQVVDVSGTPVIGANVVVKGTSNGTITDLNGDFSLSVNKNDVLSISYIGFINKETVVTDDKPLKIVLEEDNKLLKEVVVVGFGVQKKVNLTGSVGTASAEDLKSRPVTNAVQALQGVVPGLQITNTSGSMGDNPTISIRGTGTIGQGSSSSPLILINGMEGDLNTLNPEDIESISVLKDAAAASIYGSRAPFGVILVTTKSGKSGETTVSYSNSLRWGTPVVKPHIMDSYTFATYFNDGYRNSGWGTFFDSDHLQRIKDFQNGTLTTSIPVNPNNPQYWADGYGYGNANTDWYDVIYKNWSFSQEHNVSMSGGNDKLNYYTSFNYLSDNGLMKLGTENLDRYNVAAKVNSAITKWLQFNYSVRFTRNNYVRPAYMTNSLYQDLARQGWPTLPLYDPNGYYYSSPSPALGLATGGSDRTITDDTYLQGAFIAEPIANWKTHVEFNYRIKSANRHWDLLPTYNHDVDGNPVVYNTSSNVHEDYYKEDYLNLNVYSEYSYRLAEKHNFHGMLGMQVEQLRQLMFGLQRSGIIVPGLNEVDLTSGLDYYGTEVTPSVNGSRNEWATAGFFGRLNYNYNSKYLAEFNLRYDGTSKFRSNKRWGLFPSLSVGWNIANEDFFQPLTTIVSNLKLRGSYGELGNQNTTNWYQTYQILSIQSATGTWLQNGKKTNVAYVPNLVSALLGWETVRTWNAGLDYGFLNNRLNGSFDYFVRYTDNMVGNAPELPSILGTAVPVTNNTNLKTQGWEFSINWQDRTDFGLGYSIKASLSDAISTITKYPNNPTGSIDTYYDGKVLGEIWGYETIGIAKTDDEMQSHLASLSNGGQDALGTNWSAGDIMYKDIDQSGSITSGARTLSDHGDLKRIGNSTPRYLFGVNLTADYKNFDVSAFFQGVLKRDYFTSSAYFWGAVNNLWWSTGLTQHVDYFRAEPSNDLPANINSYYPRPLFNTNKNQQCQTRYLLNAAYVRLKNLQFGYSIPAKITTKWHIQKIRFFVSGENIWTGTKLPKMFDPETVSYGASSNGNAYPISKTYSGGINITF